MGKALFIVLGLAVLQLSAGADTAASTVTTPPKDYYRLLQEYQASGLTDKMSAMILDAETHYRSIHNDDRLAWASTFPKELREPLASALKSHIGKKRGYPVSKVMLAELYWGLGRTDDARMAVLSAADEARNDETPVLRVVSYGCVCQNDDNHPEVRRVGVELAKLAFDREPDSKATVLNLAECYRLTGMNKELAETARILVRKWPNDWDSVANAGGYFQTAEQWDEAIDAWKRAIVVAPDARDCARASLAGVYSAAGRYYEAISLYQSVISETKNEVVKDIARKSLAETLAKSENGGGGETVRLLTAAGKAGDAGVFTSLLLQIAMDKLPRDKIESMAASLQWTLHDPSQVLNKLFIADLYVYLGRTAEAKPLIAEVLPKITNSAMLGLSHNICTEQKEWKLSLDVCKRYAEVGTDNYGALEALTSAYIMAGDVDQGCQTAQKLVEKFPNEAWGIFHTACDVCWAGRMELEESMMAQSIQAAENAKPVVPTFVTTIKSNCWRMLIENYRRQGNKRKEVEYLTKAVELPISEDWLKEAATRLAALTAWDEQPKGDDTR